MNESVEPVEIKKPDDICPGDGFHIFSTYENVFWFFLYCTIALLSIFGNLLVVYIIAARKYMQSVTNYFILNLAAADALTGMLAIPFKFQAALLQKWLLPDFMCKTVPFIETVSLSVSVFTLTGTAVDRFRSMVFPTSPKLNEKLAKGILAAIWIVSVLCSAPYGICHETKVATWIVVNYNGTNSTPFKVCIPKYGEEKIWKIYNVYLTIVQYFVPLFIINGAYICIAYKIWVAEPPKDQTIQQEKFEKSKKRVVKMLIMVVCVFTFCWLPLETYLVLSEVRPCINAYRNINIVFFCCHWLAMSNSCLNPIIYGVYNEKFRREYKKLVLRCCGENSEYGQAMRPGSICDADSAAGINPSDSFAMGDKSHVCHNYIASELGHD